MIIFHHDDLDGRCSGAIAKKRHPDARCFEVNYETEPPIDQINGDKVVIADFCPPTKEQFDAIIKAAGGKENVVWLDHHGANIKKHPELDKELSGKRVELTPSGAMLTWEWFFPGKKAPPAVERTSDFDTWTHSLSDSRAFEAGMASVGSEVDNPVWQKLLGGPLRSATMDAFLAKDAATIAKEAFDDVVARGKIVLDFRGHHNAEVLDHYGFETEFEGHPVIACNVAHCGSDFFKSAETEGKLMMPFVFDGEQWCCSIYTDEKTDIDCAELAKKHGGGGHKSASGFRTKKFPFKNGS